MKKLIFKRMESSQFKSNKKRSNLKTKAKIKSKQKILRL